MSHLYRRPPKIGVFWLKWYQDGKPYAKSLKTKDRANAVFLKNEKEIELAKGVAVLPRKDIPPFDILAEYIKSTQQRKAPKTLKDDEARIRYFLHWAKPRAIGQIRVKTAQDYINHRFQADKISPNTANHIITTLKTWLNFAIKNNYLAENPLKQLKKYRLQKNPPRFYNTEETAKLLGAAKAYGQDFYYLIATGFYTGMRITELLNLEWQDFDWNRNIVRVVNKDGFTTKSKEFRNIPLNNKLIDILRSCKKESGYCFFPTGSRKYPPKKGFYTVLKAAGLKRTGFHILRHTFASRLVQSGVSIFKVSKWLGHKEISTTMIYSHLAPDKDEDINKI